MDFFKQNLLIIEDKKDTLELMIEIFETKFSNIYSAIDGYSALEVFRQNSINAILCDINIPKLNGLDLIIKIREINYLIPIIIISAYSDSEVLLQASNCNIQGYITKPLTSDNVNTIIKKIYYHQNHEFIDKLVQLNDTVNFDLINSQIIKENKIVKLTNKETAFLKLLLQKKGQLVPYKTIEEIIWYDENKQMSSTSLRTLVKNLRKKIANDIIENVPKIGYRLIIENN